jgi:hypothetical protein
MTASHPERRWVQYRLRILLVVVAVLAIPSGWLVAQVLQARRERLAAAAIEELGVEVGWSEPSGPTWLWALLGDDLIDGRHVDAVQLIGDKGTDAALEHLKVLDQVQILDLTGSEVTNAGLQDLRGLNQLQSLWLCGTQVSDDGLENLKGLNSLQDLYLAKTKVTDAGIKRLQQALPHCKILAESENR